MQNKKEYYKFSPFPYQGQKRQFVKHYVKVLEENIPGDGDGYTIVDAFGGSGLLSHIAKRIKPKARVIYNDFDNFSQNFLHIAEINALRQLIYSKVEHLPRQVKIPLKIKEEIKEIITNFKGYKNNYFLSNWLLFTGNICNSEDSC